MYRKFEKGSTFWGTLMVLGAIAFLAIYIIHLCQKAINESRADSILNGVVELADHEKERMDSEAESEHSLIGSIERKGYGFAIVGDSTPTLIKVETEKKTITPGVCAVLKKKLKKSMWRDTFQKVLIIDRMGDEKTDILIYDCPFDRIPALRFYVKFEGQAELETEVEEKKEPEPEFPSLPPSAPVSSPTTTSRVSAPSYATKASCPAGTSTNGAGGVATAGCRCNSAGESCSGKVFPH